jgi:hypothetical protein
MTQAPTPGRYLLYLDFKVGGEVRTAHFVLDTATGEIADAPADDEGGEEPADEHGAGESGHGH